MDSTVVITPDQWCLVRIDEDTTTVMATWSGGYLNGDSWRMNSGITTIDEWDDDWIIRGLSGSVYECHKNRYGINGYGAAVLAANELSPMDEEDALEYIRQKVKR